MSILDENADYKFPTKIPLALRLKDMLEDNVDDSYYLSQKQVDSITFSTYETNKRRIQEKDYCDTLCARDFKDPKCVVVGGIGEKNFGKQSRKNSNRYRVYDKETISPSLTTMGGGNLEPHILDDDVVVEPIIVASRGRNPDNPSDRTPGGTTEQRLEPNSQGLCNTLTSVQKDNLVLEPAILTPKRTEYGKSIRKDYESGKVQESRHNMTELQPREDRISNTLTTVQKDNLVLEKIVCEQRTDEGLRFFKGGVVGTLRTIDSCGDKRVLEPNELLKIKNGTQKGYQEAKPGDGVDLAYPTSNTRRGRVQENISQTLTADDSKGVVEQYRIRKLTPNECWRLMGIADEDFKKANKVVSNSQLYKQAGNAIVVDVLEGIFKQLFNLDEKDLER